MKTIKEMTEVMLGYDEGKKIQYRNLHNNDGWRDDTLPGWSWTVYDYRIKPEEDKPTYRPYKNTEEMIADFKERFKVDIPPNTMPLIWVINKPGRYNNKGVLVVEYLPNNVYLGSDEYSTSLETLFNTVTYIDGSPVGKLV